MFDGRYVVNSGLYMCLMDVMLYSGHGKGPMDARVHNQSELDSGRRQHEHVRMSIFIQSVTFKYTYFI